MILSLRQKKVHTQREQRLVSSVKVARSSEFLAKVCTKLFLELPAHRHQCAQCLICWCVFHWFVIEVHWYRYLFVWYCMILIRLTGSRILRLQITSTDLSIIAIQSPWYKFAVIDLETVVKINVKLRKANPTFLPAFGISENTLHKKCLSLFKINCPCTILEKIVVQKCLQTGFPLHSWTAWHHISRSATTIDFWQSWLQHILKSETCRISSGWYVSAVITARVRSTTGRYCFHRCLSVHGGGGGTEVRVPPPGGGG